MLCLDSGLGVGEARDLLAQFVHENRLLVLEGVEFGLGFAKRLFGILHLLLGEGELIVGDAALLENHDRENDGEDAEKKNDRSHIWPAR